MDKTEAHNNNRVTFYDITDTKINLNFEHDFIGLYPQQNSQNTVLFGSLAHNWYNPITCKVNELTYQKLSAYVLNDMLPHKMQVSDIDYNGYIAIDLLLSAKIQKQKDDVLYLLTYKATDTFDVDTDNYRTLTIPTNFSKYQFAVTYLNPRIEVIENRC